MAPAWSQNAQSSVCYVRGRGAATPSTARPTANNASIEGSGTASVFATPGLNRML
jgi:hypothetical protein